jgi:hypothetical protein
MLSSRALSSIPNCGRLRRRTALPHAHRRRRAGPSGAIGSSSTEACTPPRRTRTSATTGRAPVASESDDPSCMLTSKRSQFDMATSTRRRWPDGNRHRDRFPSTAPGGATHSGQSKPSLGGTAIGDPRRLPVGAGEGIASPPGRPRTSIKFGGPLTSLVPMHTLPNSPGGLPIRLRACSSELEASASRTLPSSRILGWNRTDARARRSARCVC